MTAGGGLVCAVTSEGTHNASNATDTEQSACNIRAMAFSFLSSLRALSGSSKKRTALGGPFALRSRPTLAGHIDDDAVRILELALEVLFLGIGAEVHEECAACRLHLLLSFGNVVNDEAEVVRSDEILHVGAPGALVA